MTLLEKTDRRCGHKRVADCNAQRLCSNNGNMSLRGRAEKGGAEASCKRSSEFRSIRRVENTTFALLDNGGSQGEAQSQLSMQPQPIDRNPRDPCTSGAMRGLNRLMRV